MAGILADTGAANALSVWMGALAQATYFEIHLYTDNITPDDSSTEASFTEASGGGYAAQQVMLGVAFIDSVSITSSSAANPTNILAPSHGLATNDYATIANHAGSVSNINGTHQVTKVDNDNFTIPIDLTGGGGTGGTVSRGFNQTAESGIEVMVANPVPFYFTGALSGNATIYGYWLEDDNNVFIGAEKFNTTFTPSSAGDTLNVTPKVRLSKGTAT